MPVTKDLIYQKEQLNFHVLWHVKAVLLRDVSGILIKLPWLVIDVVSLVFVSVSKCVVSDAIYALYWPV